MESVKNYKDRGFLPLTDVLSHLVVAAMVLDFLITDWFTTQNLLVQMEKFSFEHQKRFAFALVLHCYRLLA